LKVQSDKETVKRLKAEDKDFSERNAFHLDLVASGA